MTAYLSGRGIAYEERNVGAHPMAVRDLVCKYGSRTTPTMVIDEEVITGFDPVRLDQIFAD
ncbi:MAG: hypothetical protein JO266_06010 [Acidobacteria bacterium]|nr:hypothetical protein [Acidobacteriota bacterium]